MSEWQDISTAPMDGTLIILYDNDGDVLPGFYVRGFDDGMGFKFDGGWESNDGHSHFTANPTHWMPLPAPPVTP